MFFAHRSTESIGADYVDSEFFYRTRNLFILTILPRKQLTVSLMTMRHLINYHMPYFNQNVQISQRTFLNLVTTRLFGFDTEFTCDDWDNLLKKGHFTF